MILPDVNVPIYAFRRDSGGHRVCKPWLDSVVGGDTQFGVSPLSLAAVARIIPSALMIHPFHVMARKCGPLASSAARCLPG
jgi:predicted nucleic acid-binding protein